MHFRYRNDPLDNANVIIDRFIDRKFPFMPGVKNHRIIHTDVSTSVLAWVEDNVVFELYFMHPNVEVVSHSHPFWTTTLFLLGDMKGGWDDELPFMTESPWLTEASIGIRKPIHPPGRPHGFIVGPRGASFYTIQIWDHIVTDPKSATEHYIGEPLGPIHAVSLNNNYK